MKGQATLLNFATAFFLFIYVATYVMLISNQFSVGWMLVLAVLHGFFTALIGLNITHDAMHGAYTQSPKANYRIGLLFNLIGANDYMWKISHNVLHHTFMNVAGHDADVDQLPLLRLNTQQERWWIHRFQYIYVFFFYSLTTIAWVFFRDFAEFFHPEVNGYKRTKTPSLRVFENGVFQVYLLWNIRRHSVYSYCLVLALYFDWLFDNALSRGYYAGIGISVGAYR